MLDRTRDALDASLATSLSRWTDAKRLYTLQGEGPVGGLMVERFQVVDAVSEPFQLQLDTLSLDAFMDPLTLLGRPVALHTTLSDGSRCRRSGLVMHAEARGSDGGLARYRLLVQPWVALLAHQRHSRAWQGRSVIGILDDVLAAPACRPHAAWRWGEAGEDGSREDLAAFLSRGPNRGVRPFCAQYRETDLAFLQRLLAEEGLGWRVEECNREQDGAPSGHRLVFFADSARWPQNASSRSPWGGNGIRFHGASAVEPQDTIQRFGQVCQLQPTGSAVLQWNPDAKCAVAGEATSVQAFGSRQFQDGAAWLQHYDPLGSGAETCADTARGAPGTTRSEAEHRATCRQQAFEARHETWLAQGTVRSLRAGQWFTLTQSLLEAAASAAEREFAVHTVHAAGLNNLPKDVREHLARAGADDDAFVNEWGPADVDLPGFSRLDPQLMALAAAHGHANRFEAVRRAVPWRPLPAPRATALGLQTAVVVGPTGAAMAEGADELYTDARGRVRVRFHWQAALNDGEVGPAHDNASAWVRVAQRWAGAGTGHQFIPRIGQEVLVQFIEGDVDRPVCVGAVFNGRGEGGASPTPGGREGVAGAASGGLAYSRSSDHCPSAQGHVSGGHAPAWHGGAPGFATTGAHAQNNIAALSGVKSKEFGGPGFNQLVFDDTPGQLRVQLASTQHASQLNLGHLVHPADNHRGSFRGRGFELRTDAYGAVRGARGLLLTSHGASARSPAGDNASGMALLQQAAQLAEGFARAAKTHQATSPALATGTVAPGESVLSERAAPLRALQRAAAGMVAQASFFGALRDAGQHVAPGTARTLPHTTDPIVALTGQAGLAVVAGQELQFASDDAIGWQAGHDLHLAAGRQLRLNTGQSLGVLAGAVRPGTGADGQGLALVAAQGPVQMQAQAGPLQVAAHRGLALHSVRGAIDWTAAKKVTLQTSGGAQIVIEAGGIDVACPGKLTVRAARKSFVASASERHAMPQMPRSFLCAECLHKAMRSGSPLAAVS